jgi:hypothetical protein
MIGKLRSGMAGGIKFGPPQLTSVSATYTVLTDDEMLLCDASSGAFTVTLPAPTEDVPPFYLIKRTNASGNVTIATNGSETIDGAATYVLSSQYDAVILTTDGSNWYVFGRRA